MWIAVTAILAALSIASAPAPVDLSGTWAFDTYLSDNPGQVAAALRADLGRTDFSPFGESSDRRGFGRGAGRRGQQTPAASNRASAPSEQEQRALDAVTAIVRYPPLTLRIAQTDAAVTIDDAQGQSRTFTTNGKRETQMFDATRADSTARWEGPQLVADFDLGNGRKMIYTYSIVPTTRQLLVRVAFERAPNQPGPFEIKFVYDR
jgi:hypothetical protein